MIYFNHRNISVNKWVKRILMWITVQNGLLGVAQTVQYQNMDIQQVQDTTNKLNTEQISKLIEHSISIQDRNPDSTITLLTELVTKSLQLNYYDGVIGAFLNMASCFMEKGDYDKSLQCFRRALYYAEKGNYSKAQMALLYTSMGGPWFYKGQLDSATFYYYKAEYEIRNYKIKNVADADKINKVYMNLGVIWGAVGNASNAIGYFKKAEIIARSFNRLGNLASTCYNIGCFYTNEGKNDSARPYYLQAIENGKVYNETAFRAATINLAIILLQEKKPGQASLLLKQVIQLYPRSRNNKDFIRSFGLLGEAYTQLRAYSLAEEALLLSIKKAESTHYEDESISEWYDRLSDIYNRTGRYKDAFVYQQKSRRLLDTLQKKESLKTIYELETKSRNAEKDKQLAESKLLISQQQNRLKDRGILIGGTTAGIVILSLALGGTIRHNRNSRRLQKQKMRNMEQSNKIEQLQAMVQGEEKERARIARELHDGVMSQFLALKLNIKSLKKDHPGLETDGTYQQVMQQVADAAEELRDTSHRLIPEILLHGLPEAIRSFCEKLNKSHPMKLDFQQYDPLPPLNYNFSLSVYRIVQELVQNIIKHSEATEAIIQINCSDGMMSLTIEDNGKGFDKEQTNGGAGLRNVQQRVEALKGTMDLQTETGTGTAVYMEFEVQRLEDGVCSD